MKTLFQVEADPAIDEIYRAYPRHVHPVYAKTCIEKAVKRIAKEMRMSWTDATRWLLGRVGEYAKAMKGKDKKFVPHCSTWMNRGGYADDESEWTVGEKTTEADRHAAADNEARRAFEAEQRRKAEERRALQKAQEKELSDIKELISKMSEEDLAAWRATFEREALPSSVAASAGQDNRHCARLHRFILSNRKVTQ